LAHRVHRVGGPIFFANVEKFVDRLYGDVVRPMDVSQQLAAGIVVSAPGPEERRVIFVDDSPTQYHIRTNGLQSTQAAAAEAEVLPCDTEQTLTSGNKAEGNSAAVRVIVLDFCRVTFVDSMALAALKKMYEAYRGVGVQVVISGCDAVVAAAMTAAGVAGDSGEQMEEYPTVHDAVVALG